MTKLVEFGAILTGGAAKRMGGSKADLPIGGISMSERVLKSISPFTKENICIGHINPLLHLGIKQREDLYPGKSSMGGVATALAFALKESGPDSWVLIVGCDMPLIKPQVLELLLAHREDNKIVMPQTSFGYEPLCALYRADLLLTVTKEIERGNLQVLHLLELVKAHRLCEKEIRRVDPELLSFINVNRPEDLKRVKELLP
jgi:molybdopterin-guanine dinucleotide biosynthesis protein A